MGVGAPCARTNYPQTGTRGDFPGARRESATRTDGWMEGQMQKISTTLAAALIEREREVRAILLGLIAREHVLMVGPPGTAKSLAARSVAQAISGAHYCERLLSPTCPPEALFGPVSLAALREDRYEHVGAGTATDAHILFLDEVWRASDAIRDTLLHILGPERQALIGTQQVRVPLISAVGAANSWPDSADASAALDRWLIRLTVRPVSPQGRDRLLYADLPAVTPVATLADVIAAGDAAAALPVSADARVALSAILDELAGAGIRVSDRRARLSVRVARAAAQLDGAAEVAPHHLEDLSMVLWCDPAQADRAGEIISRVANPVGARINEILRAVDETVQDCGADAAKRMAAIKKLEESEREIGKLSAQGNGRAKAASTYIRRERVRMQAAALGIDPAKAEALLGAAS